MKSIVLDGERIAEAIQKTRDNLINGEYDTNDLILRGDALKAIRQKCISEHLPFKSNTPEGERVLNALAAVYQVKPYKDVCGKWISVKDRLPKSYTALLLYGRLNPYSAMYTQYVGFWDGEKWISDGKEIDGVTHWMPLPKPPEEPHD